MAKNENYAITARIITSIIFGCSFLFSKEGLTYFLPMQLLSCRFIVAIALLQILRAEKALNISVRFRDIFQNKELLILVIFQPILGYYFEMQGVARLTAAESGVILALIPIFVTVMGIFILHEKPNRYQCFFVVLSFIGVLFILIIKGEPISKSSISGFVYFLISAACAAAFNIYSRKAALNYSSADITYSMMLIGAIFFTVASIIQAVFVGRGFSTDLSHIEASVVFSVLFLGIISSVIGFLLTNYSLAVMTAFRVAIFNNLAMTIAIIIGVLVTKDRFTAIQVIGALIVMLGVWGVQYYAKDDE